MNASTVQARIAAIESATRQLPAPLRPAAEFQKVLLQIRAGAGVPAWCEQMNLTAQYAGSDPVLLALRELARYWQARLEVRVIDKALRKFYGANVCFPAQLNQVTADIPEPLRIDPWSEPWAYKPTAAPGFANIPAQRYELGPSRFPHLSPLEAAVRAEPAVHDWKIVKRDAPGGNVLEIRTSDGKAVILQPGGRVGEASLAFIGDGWALFTDSEGLFTVAY